MGELGCLRRRDCSSLVRIFSVTRLVRPTPDIGSQKRDPRLHAAR